MDEVAHAIADPVRRTILEALAGQPRTAGELAAMFPVSRPAVSRHLRVLRECGLVVDEVQGRHRLYAIDLAALHPLASWLGQLGQPDRLGQTAQTAHFGQPDRAASWDHRLDALTTEVHRTRRDRRHPPVAQQEETG